LPLLLLLLRQPTASKPLGSRAPRLLLLLLLLLQPQDGCCLYCLCPQCLLPPLPVLLRGVGLRLP
jgi:hypothetical protein